MRFHTLRRRQLIPALPEDVFAFFADAGNLEELTPPWLKFRILTAGAIHIEAGTEIRYRISWHGVPVRWKTRIIQWSPPYRFVDFQLRGPYRLWHHTHRFQACEGGTLMTDIVRYGLPFGIIGEAAHAIVVRRDVEKIFDYRFKRITELFPGNSGLSF
jgi:ligand-binding SRPBCC domain-containing protein